MELSFILFKTLPEDEINQAHLFTFSLGTMPSS